MMKTNKKLFNLLVIFLAATSWCLGQQDTLTLSQSINLALKNNPQIRIAQGTLQSAQANETLTRSTLFPQVTFQTGWAINGGSFIIGNRVNPPQTFQNYSLGLQGQALIYDFGRTFNRVEAAEDITKSSGQDLTTAKQTLILSTATAYYNYLAAQRIALVAKDVTLQAQAHLTSAQGFFNVGRSPQYDVISAQTSLANAQVNQLAAEGNAQIGRVQLENIIGVRIPDNTVIKDDLGFVTDSISFKDAIDKAIASRPEIASRKLLINANQALVRSAWDANLPSVSATGGYLWRTFSLDQPLINSWNAGVTLSVPIFQGFAIDANEQTAKANLDIAQANYDATVLSVNLDVQQQYLSYNQARNRIAATNLLVQQAEAQLRLAQGRYNQGVGSPIEVTDAEVSYFNAQTANIQALYDYQTAYARLQRAMGVIR